MQKRKRLEARRARAAKRSAERALKIASSARAKKRIIRAATKKGGTFYRKKESLLFSPAVPPDVATATFETWLPERVDTFAAAAGRFFDQAEIRVRWKTRVVLAIGRHKRQVMTTRDNLAWPGKSAPRVREVADELRGKALEYKARHKTTKEPLTGAASTEIGRVREIEVEFFTDVIYQ